MSSIIFTLVGLDGEVVPFTSFKIEAVAPDGVYDPEYIVPAPVIITTDAEGVATVELEATVAPYFITRLSGTIDDFIALKFFVPESPIPIQAEMLYVDLAKHQKLHTDRALYALIETKVAMLHALNLSQLNQGVVSVNGFGGTVVLGAVDVGADPAGTGISTSAAAVATHTGAVDPHGDRAYADSLVVGLWDDRGNFDASVNAYPSSGGSGAAGAILKGNIWTVSVGGNLPTGQVVGVGDTVRALIDAPGNTQANWAIQEHNLGYTPENSSNKSTSTSLGLSDTLYPSQKAVKGYVDFSVAAINTPSNMASVITRGQKFGQFTRWSHTNPNGVYSFQSPSGGGYVVLTTTKLATISGGAAISDALYWNITSASSGSAFTLSTVVWSQTSGNVVSTRWQTGDKMQAIFSLSLTDLAPSPTDDFVFRVGFANTTSQAITAADVFSSGTSGAHDGSAAYFYADKDSAYWKCESGHLTTTETTVTTVAVAIDVLHVFHVVIATNGAVSFYIDGGLVATHTTGVIASGKCLNESMGFRNRATTATANKGCILDQIEFRHALANQRTGFAFV